MNSLVLFLFFAFIVACLPVLGVIAGVMWKCRQSEKSHHGSGTQVDRPLSDIPPVQRVTRYNTNESPAPVSSISTAGYSRSGNTLGWWIAQRPIAVSGRGHHATPVLDPFRPPPQTQWKKRSQAWVNEPSFRNAWYFALLPILMFILFLLVLLAGLAAS